MFLYEFVKSIGEGFFLGFFEVPGEKLFFCRSELNHVLYLMFKGLNLNFQLMKLVRSVQRRHAGPPGCIHKVTCRNHLKVLVSHFYSLLLADSVRIFPNPTSSHSSSTAKSNMNDQCSFA